MNIVRTFMTILITLTLVASGVTAGKWYWQKRIDHNVDIRHKHAHEKVSPSIWPAEPVSPAAVDGDTFRRSLGVLCGKMPPERLVRFATSILEHSESFEVDPFLLAALMYDRSECRPKTPEKETKWGVTRIDVEMHAPHIRGGQYRYFLLEQGSWVQRTLEINKYPFNKWKAQKTDSNLYFAAAFLRIFSLQCSNLDEAFNGARHRHFVSHWFFGDRVKNNEPEDRVLTARRRLLSYYNEAFPEAAGTFRNTPLSSPLDGVPRLVIAPYDEQRKGRKHQGVDIVGVTGEPVRAVADGRVSFAGVDLPSPATSRQTSSDEAIAMPNSSLGAGGIWITLNHGNDFRSVYMHLSSLSVSQGDTVKSGDIIGTLGRTGTVSSGPHLHLEFRVEKGRVNPAVPLSDVIVNPFH
jgi:murein DD-endopeptidase MepM/ murein hydrolase activator NlpD